MGTPDPSGRKGPTPLAVTAAGVLAVLCAGWAVAARGEGWFAAFLRNPLTILMGILLLASLAATVVLLPALWRLGQAARRVTRSGRAGTASIEFVLVLVVAVPIVLIMIQSMLLVVGNLAVHYAAYNAARAAVVWVPEKVYGQAGVYGSDWQDGDLDEPRNVVSGTDGSVKYRHVRNAAVYSVMPVCAGNEVAGARPPVQRVQEGLQRFFSANNQTPPTWITKQLANKLCYADNYTEVELALPANGTVYGDFEDLRVRVRHTLYMSVPYANRVMAFFSGKELGNGHYGTDVEVWSVLTNQGLEDDIDLEVFPRYVGRGQN